MPGSLRHAARSRRHRWHHDASVRPADAEARVRGRAAAPRGLCAAAGAHRSRRLVVRASRPRRAMRCGPTHWLGATVEGEEAFLRWIGSRPMLAWLALWALYLS